MKNNLEIVPFDPKSKKTDGRKKYQNNNLSKGSWTEDRQLALLRAYRVFRPYGALHGNKTTQWNLVTDAVNSKSPAVTPLRKQAVKDKLDEFVKRYKPLFCNPDMNKKNELYRRISKLDREIHETREMYMEDINAESNEQDRLKRKISQMAIEDNIAQKKRRKEASTQQNINKKSVDEEDNKLLQASQKNHREILNALENIHDSVKTFHQDMLRIFDNKS